MRAHKLDEATRYEPVSYSVKWDCEATVQILRGITNGFINFFGITQPTPKQERQAEIFIIALLVLILIMASLVFIVIVMAVGK